MSNQYTKSHKQGRKGQESGAYKSWTRMKVRCMNKNDKSYPRYGGRGITVCERWLSFDNFYEDMGDRPEGTSLDRIDNNGNYEHSNCSWATSVQQQANKRNTKLIECFGKAKTAKQWELETGVDAATLTRRIKAGIQPDVALTMVAVKGRKLSLFAAMQPAADEAGKGE